MEIATPRCPAPPLFYRRDAAELRTHTSVIFAEDLDRVP